MPGVSSIQIGAELRMPAARARRGKSSSRSMPLRSRCASMRASDVSMRCTSDSLLISSEKNATGTLFSIAACCAMLSMNAVFPIDGRAATMTRSDGWKPDVISSRSLKPLATPVIVLPPRWSASMRSIVGQSSSLMRVKPSVRPLLADLEDLLLGFVEQLVGRLPPLERLGDDRRSRPR